MSSDPGTPPAAERDWYAWHAFYDNPRSAMSRRLSWVQDQIRAALDNAPAGPVRAISLCAGQRRDVVGALVGHPRRGDVTARPVELDPRNTAFAAAADLDNIEVVTGDAALARQYADMVPAELVVAMPLNPCITSATGPTAVTVMLPLRGSRRDGNPPAPRRRRPVPGTPGLRRAPGLRRK